MKKNLLLLSIFIACGTSIFAQVPSYVPTTGLVGWWPFNGNANDESGNGNNGTVNGANLTSDRFGNGNKAYSFDGLNDFIDVPNSNSLQSPNTSITISVWFRINDWDNNFPPFGYASFISKSDINSVQYRMSASTIDFSFVINATNWKLSYSQNSVQLGTWYNLVVTSDQNGNSFFLNGSFLGVNNNQNAEPFGVSQNVEFGRDQIGGVDYFNGKLDDIGIWNRALTFCEIQDLYNAQLNSANGISAGVDQSICSGENVTLQGAGGSSYVWNNSVTNGQSFTPTNSNNYILFGTAPNGCLGTDTVSVVVLQNSTSSQSQTACNSYTWNGNTYTQSGQYSYLTVNANGCDSTATLNLTINQSSSSTQTQTSIDSYTWPVNGQTYTQSGTYSAVIPNVAGCDSTITLDLTLNFTGIDEKENSKIIISPNPASDYFMLRASEELIGESYRIIDLNGKTLKEGTLTQKEQKIEIGNLSEGMYMFKINNETEQTFRIVKN
jgi:hypothetical protein